MNRKSTLQRAGAALLGLGILLGALPLSAAGASEGVVNINQANVEELARLPRVGPTVAQRIVSFREENGPFQSLEDLLLVKGIGDRTFDQLRPYITLEGETTLEEKVRVSRTDSSSEEG